MKRHTRQKTQLRTSSAATFTRLSVSIVIFAGKRATFLEKTAGNRDLVETLLLECDIRMLEKLFK
jgi:hypothetical protein